MMNDSVVQPARKEFLCRDRYVPSVQQVRSKARSTQDEKNVLNVGNPEKQLNTQYGVADSYSYIEKYTCKY